MMNDYRTLKVWARAHQLTLGAYAASRGFPGDERFGLVSQLRRSAASIPANIAEGSGRHGKAELAHFVSMAAGSAAECEYHLRLALDLGYLSPESHGRLRTQTGEVRRMLSSLFASLQTDRKRLPG